MERKAEIHANFGLSFLSHVYVMAKPVTKIYESVIFNNQFSALVYLNVFLLFLLIDKPPRVP